MKKIISILSTSLIFTACQKVVEPPPPPRPALVIIAGQSAAKSNMVLVGEVKSRYASNQGFRISGKIVERKVEVGSFVKKGQVLARLDATDTNLGAQAATADVRAAESSYALAQSEVERQRTLFNKKFISASALDMREAELKTSAARLQQVKAQAAVSGNQSRYTALIADQDGVVTQIQAEPGQVVEAGAVIAQVVDNKQLEVLVAVPESRIENLKTGSQVSVKLWANRERTYIGKVREIAPAANSATRAFDVRVTIVDADEAMKLGMTAGVNFVENAMNAIIVPSTALTQINGKNTVWVVDKSNVANPREVITGPYSEVGVVIKSGLLPNEMVAIAGVHTLIKGQKVQPKIEDSL
jgi:multidrug efflux system membrane fusion protein